MTSFRRYNIPSINGEGWAVVVLDLKDGYFSTVSDWGNYSYMWPNIGEGLGSSYVVRLLTPSGEKLRKVVRLGFGT